MSQPIRGPGNKTPECVNRRKKKSYEFRFSIENILRIVIYFFQVSLQEHARRAADNGDE